MRDIVSEPGKMPSLGIGGKLTIGFGALVGITLLVVGFGFFAGLSATRSISVTEELREPILHAATATQTSLLKAQMHLRGYLISGKSDDAAQYEASRKAFEKQLKTLKPLLAQSSADRDMQQLAELEAIYQEWAKLPLRLFSLHDNPLENRLALQLSRVEVQPLRTQVLDEIDELLNEGGRTSRQATPAQDAFSESLARFRISFDATVWCLAAYAASGERSFKLAYGTYAAASGDSWNRVHALRPSLSASRRAKLDVIGHRRSEVTGLAQKIFTIIESDRVYEDLYLYRTQAVPQADRMIALLGEVERKQGELFRGDLREARRSLDAARTQTLTGGLIAVLFGTATAFLLRRKIVGTLRRLTGVAGQIAGGDLSRRASVESGDEIGVLAKTLNTMTERLSETIRKQETALAEAQLAKRETEAACIELHAVQSELVDTARQAGMAEIATNVLHNVGNVLNSVNVSTGVVSSQVRNSKVTGLGRAVQMINAHAADLGAFFTHDEHGKLLPGYLSRLADALAAEQRVILDELGHLTKSVAHIKDIVATQQSYAGTSRLIEPVQIRDLVDDALRMNAGALMSHDVTVVKECAEVPVLPLDRHHVLQILVNLISNANQAMDAMNGRPHRMTLRVGMVDTIDGASGRSLQICVADEGDGISAENLTHIFNHGFTTRQNGHGFGLHSCVLAAREMGGTLTAQSDGPGLGAAFTLSLPVAAGEAGA